MTSFGKRYYENEIENQKEMISLLKHVSGFVTDILENKPELAKDAIEIYLDSKVFICQNNIKMWEKILKEEK